MNEKVHAKPHILFYFSDGDKKFNYFDSVEELRIFKRKLFEDYAELFKASFSTLDF